MDKQNIANNKCRTCLNKVKGLQSLQKLAIEGAMGDMSYAELLKEVTDINVMDDKSDELPQFICGCCSRKLKSSHAFIKLAQDSQEKLQLLLLGSETSYKQSIDCLQESQIDIQTCLEIKIESDNEDEDVVESNKYPMVHCEVQLKSEGSDECPLDDNKQSFSVERLAKENEDEELTSLNGDFDTDSSKVGDIDFSPSVSDNDDLVSNEDAAETSPDKEKRKQRKKNAAKDLDTKDASIAVPCLQCNKIFKNAKVLSRHLRNTHIPEEQKCACPVCGVKFTRACNMFKHMRTQHDPESVKSLLPTTEKMHQCDKCPQKYTKKKHLNNHIKAKHTNDTECAGDKAIDDSKSKSEERSLCSFCGCSFSKKAYLIVHMRRHTGERPFKCDLCERAFAHNSELKCHRRIHTGEKPYKCKLCEKAFRVYKKLATHMRSHTDERPYKCTQCERSFKYSKDLNIHTRIHTGERPYCCTVCGSTFTQSNSLKAHRMKLGHMEESAAVPPPQTAPPQLMHLLT